MACGIRFENMIGWEVICGSLNENAQEVLCNKCRKSEESQQEKCGDTFTRQHRHGTHPEEWQVSKENDMATVDNTLSELSEVKDDK